MRMLLLIFQLFTVFARPEQVHVLHDSHVHVIAPVCDRVDQWSNDCSIDAGERVTELRVEMPCAWAGTRLFFSVIRVGYMHNWSVWVDNPCAQLQWFPIVFGG